MRRYKYTVSSQFKAGCALMQLSHLLLIMACSSLVLHSPPMLPGVTVLRLSCAIYLSRQKRAGTLYLRIEYDLKKN